MVEYVYASLKEKSSVAIKTVAPGTGRLWYEFMCTPMRGLLSTEALKRASRNHYSLNRLCFFVGQGHMAYTRKNPWATVLFLFFFARSLKCTSSNSFGLRIWQAHVRIPNDKLHDVGSDVKSTTEDKEVYKESYTSDTFANC